MTPVNGHVTTKWLVGAMTAIIGTGVLLWMSDQAEARRDTAERLLRMEARQNGTDVDIAGMRTDLAYIRTTLLRIEAKLER